MRSVIRTVCTATAAACLPAIDANPFTTALRCLNPLPEPSGTSCSDTFTARGVDRQRAPIDQIAPQWGTTLDASRGAPRGRRAR
ncbi:hypothetical protein [Rhodococcus tukisamuensis]|uniref:Uncharacterized protein n=1 Tax=Rhodococcus tukisamuensis TaxID=168276 RepID=A0A1G7DE88_9NOCA|nr:hypothetical protein [Rhodococcus tukisamuensis]SDE49862.1 hypothetical protein SAMN05444580_11910 [Rhodococcus tukisamuensis]